MVIGLAGDEREQLLHEVMRERFSAPVQVDPARDDSPEAQRERRRTLLLALRGNTAGLDNI